MAAALQHVEPDRCPFQSTFTPEFAVRLRGDLDHGRAHAHNPHGGGNTYELEIELGEDLLLTSVGWANCYYQDDEHDYVDEWGIGWRVVEYTTPYGVGHYTEPRGHPLADAAALSSYRPPDPNRDLTFTRTPPGRFAQFGAGLLDRWRHRHDDLRNRLGAARPRAA